MSYGQIIAAIQCYIHHVKGVEVQINLPRNVGEIKKMQQMYNIASAYLSL
jgi:RNase P/RNase MRP subunit POP5